MSNKKNKKKKTVYIDDGRTIADMSGLSGRTPLSTDQPYLRGARGTAKERWQTYLAAVKMMFLPMLAVIGGIMLIFVIVLIAFSLAY